MRLRAFLSRHSCLLTGSITTTGVMAALPSGWGLRSRKPRPVRPKRLACHKPRAETDADNRQRITDSGARSGEGASAHYRSLSVRWLGDCEPRQQIIDNIVGMFQATG